MTAEELPMFPLGTVLLPATAITLHVFEPRYRALVRHCLDGDRRLGVVLIERGSEVGGGDVRFDVATQGRIDEAVELPDGRRLIAVAGERRVRVRQWLPDDPYPRAEVEPCDDGPAGAAAAARHHDIVQLLQRVVSLRAKLGEAADRPLPALHPSVEVATWQAAGLAPLGPLDAQRLLATDGSDARVDLLLSLLDEQAAMLALREAGG